MRCPVVSHKCIFLEAEKVGKRTTKYSALAERCIKFFLFLRFARHSHKIFVDSGFIASISSAILKLQLVVLQSATTPYSSHFYKATSLSASATAMDSSSYWEARINRALKELCHASTGFQRVASIRHLSTHSKSDYNGRALTFEVILYSTGHGKTLASLEELIKHRLDEAYLPGLGSLDPEASYVQRLEESMPGRRSANLDPFSKDRILLCFTNDLFDIILARVGN